MSTFAIEVNQNAKVDSTKTLDTPQNKIVLDDAIRLSRRLTAVVPDFCPDCRKLLKTRVLDYL